MMPSTVRSLSIMTFLAVMLAAVGCRTGQQEGAEVFKLTGEADSAALGDRVSMNVFDVEDVAVETGEEGESRLTLTFTDEGTTKFQRITRENINRRLQIVVGGRVVSTPVVRAEMTGGQAVITGFESREEAEQAAAKIRQAIMEGGVR